MKPQPIKKQAAPGVQGPEAVAATSANRNNQGNYTPTLTNRVRSKWEILPAEPTKTDIQETAIDLYSRGFNVIPLRRGTKKAFILSPFFTSRLHHCILDKFNNPLTCTGALSHAGRNDISELFRHNNIGVIAGRTSGNLVAIDCDSNTAFKDIRHELTSRALPFWAISGHKGGACLMRIIEGEAGNVAKSKSKFADVEIWGNRRLIVLPPSIHPLGDVYQWVTPEPRFSLAPYTSIPPVSISALDWLGAALDLEARKEWEEPNLHGLPEWAAGLSKRNRETFTDVLSEGERNNRIFALACDMHGIGVDYSEAERVILDIARRAGSRKREVLSTLKSAYKKDREPARSKENTQREWQRAKTFASSFDWRSAFGRRALTRQAVYMACVERARREGRVVWRATAREIAELANMGKEPACAALLELENAGLIKRINKAERFSAAIYKFMGLSVGRTVYLSGCCCVRPTDTPKTTAEQDIFRKLGRNAWHVWRYLLKQPADGASEIARNTKLARSSVYQALKLLQHDNVRLVFRSEGKYYGEPRTDNSFAVMAAHWFDGSSPSEKRKATHRLERERRLNSLTERAIYKFMRKF